MGRTLPGIVVQMAHHDEFCHIFHQFRIAFLFISCQMDLKFDGIADVYFSLEGIKVLSIDQFRDHVEFSIS